MVEARLGHIHIEEPAEQQVVVQLLAEQPFAAHRVERHQQRGLQQPLGRDRRPSDRAVHLIEQRRKLPERHVGEFLDPPQWMLLGHPIARLHHHQHHPLPPLFTSHPPPPPLIRLATHTNYITMKFRRLSTALYVADVVEPSTDAARQAGAALGKVPRLAAKVAAPSRRSSPNGCKGRKSRIARLGKQRDEVR